MLSEKPQNKVLLTEAEKDLIEAIRNYKKTYPDGHPELLWFAQELFDRLIDPLEDNDY
jgi:hypothetical protein